MDRHVGYSDVLTLWEKAVLAGQSWGAWEGCRKSTENNLCLFLQMQSSGSGWSWTQWQKCKHINASKAIWLCSKCEVLKLRSQWRFELPKKSWAAEECWINPIHHMFSEGQVEGSFSLGTPRKERRGMFHVLLWKVSVASSFLLHSSQQGAAQSFISFCFLWGIPLTWGCPPGWLSRQRRFVIHRWHTLS